ncbi:MAG: glycine/betaine ABC transporter substrate-binding protein [Desulfobacterales bacterium]|nr:glycine/betaine ABC transporter substrate-binding protein [Desulfobacterales bacterium]
MRKLNINIVAPVLIIAVMIMAHIHGHAAEKRVTVGNKNFTEQYVVGQLMKQILEARGFRVDLRPDLTSMALRAGMESGDIDICAEYTGTAWMVHLKREYKPGTDNNRLYAIVRNADNTNNFIWLDPIWNNNTYGLASWPEFANKHNLTNLSDLAALYGKKKGKFNTFVNFEFSTRPDGLPAMERFYNFKVARTSLKTGTPGASLIALKEHMTQVAMVFGTDASIAKYGWHVYSDDKSFFPPYDLTPCIRKEVLDRYPEIANILKCLVATFPGGGKHATPEIVTRCQKTWRELNAEVDIDKKEPAEVAYEYLRRHGLIKDIIIR